MNGAFRILFVGSGVSIRAGLPNWHDLLMRLAIHHDRQFPSVPLLGEVQQQLGESGKNRDRYLAVGSLIQKAFEVKRGGSFEGALRQILDSPSLMELRSDVHELIAELPWERIITTNYDRLLERAAGRSDRHKGVRVTHPNKDDFLSAQTHDQSPNYVIKIHGDIADGGSSIVLSKESFEELYDTDSKLKETYKSVVGTVLRAASVILFVGYSHDDNYIRKLFGEEMYIAVRDRAFALVAREGTPDDFEERIDTLTEELRIRFITYSPDEGHRELLEFLTYFTDADTHESEYESCAALRRPSVVLVHCGGTIGSEPRAEPLEGNQPLEVVVRSSRYDKELHAFSRTLLRGYEDTFGCEEGVAIDILWETMPVSFQMFSENATPELWNHLSRKIEDVAYKYFQAPTVAGQKQVPLSGRLGEIFREEYNQYKQVYPAQELTEAQFRSDFENRYILGVIVLFGTDTLAIASSAVALATHDLPCPIVFTGANHSPLEMDPAARSQFYATSDAPRNLMNSIYFLQCFGHRLTELFVCFGNTVHNAINLRKRAAEIVPSGRDLLTDRSEPFVFRNLSFNGQYMFKLIDGIFCNNYYPVGSTYQAGNYIHYSSLVGPEADKFSDLRHIRSCPFETSLKQMKGRRFSCRVAYVEVSPCFPLMDVERMIAAPEGDTTPRVVLVEGYPSGTFPSQPGSAFSRLLLSLYDKGIPVAMVSRYGILASQQEYALMANDRVAVLRLYGIVAETALPLLSLVVSELSDDQWDEGAATGNGLTERRLKLLQSGIDAYFHSRKDILSLELEGVTNKDRMQAQLIGLQQLSGNRDSERQRQFRDRGRFPFREAIKPLVDARRIHYAGGFVLFSRADLLLFFDEILRLFEKVGAGPDGLEAIFNIGFEMGLPLWDSFRADIPLEEFADPHSSNTLAEVDALFFERDGGWQAARLCQANRILKRVCNLVDNAGVTRITVDRNICSMQRGGDRAERCDAGGGGFGFSLVARKFGTGNPGEEKYAAMTCTKEESRFFQKLAQGPDDKGIARRSKELNAMYTRLLRNTWVHSTRTIDWFLLGLFKGICCGIAQFLNIDELATKAPSVPRFAQGLRQRVSARIERSDADVIEISYRYFQFATPPDE